jgi:hypothetical protein
MNKSHLGCMMSNVDGVSGKSFSRATRSTVYARHVETLGSHESVGWSASKIYIYIVHIYIYKKFRRDAA